MTQTWPLITVEIILFVPCPDVIVDPAGTVHVYDTAPATAGTEKPPAPAVTAPGVPSAGEAKKFHPVLLPILVEP